MREGLSFALTGGRMPGAVIRVQKAADIVAADIRGAIIRGALRDGDSLPAEAHLVAQYDVSRPTLREAIRILESEGLLTVSRGARGGARINAPTFEMVARATGIALQGNGATMRDIYDLRSVIEASAARLAAEAKDRAIVAALRGQLEEERAALADGGSLGAAFAEFHHILVDGCGNVATKIVGHSLQQVMESHMALAQRHLSDRASAAVLRQFRRALRSQARLVDHIEQGDGAGAEQHWLEHMRVTGAYWFSEKAPATRVELLR